ncbi:uncharacterized protein [Gossypium hirsutum]|uniref:Uncharacterized protein isoform X4 n=1 Tax=Gossypium hirsutum TaxID=3635 RepID=A0ABM3AXY9_GOSHI|nr:uncharacterized protein LOC107935318 isoform X4 [Gossypium hirsutum]
METPTSLISLNFQKKKVAIWNPSTREFKILPPSSVQRPTYPGLTFGVLVYPVEGIDKSFDLWVMNGEEWTKQFSIESIPGVVDPLGFWKNNELFLLNTNYEVVLFDPSTQELKVLGINSYLDHHREYVSLFFYVESLVSISGIQEHKDHIIRQLVGDASKNLNRNIDQVDTKYDDG